MQQNSVKHMDHVVDANKLMILQSVVGTPQNSRRIATITILHHTGMDYAIYIFIHYLSSSNPW
jgi:hypothetical protein